MSFLSQIPDEPVYAAIKQANKDPGTCFVLYGATACAEYIADKAIDLGVRIEHVVVDDRYVNSSHIVHFRGMPVQRLTSLKGRKGLHWLIGFYNDDLTETVASRMQAIREAGIDVTKVFVMDYALLVRPWRIFDRQFLLEQERSLQQTYDLLGDELSRRTMVAFLDQRVNGAIGPIDEVRVGQQYFGDPVRLGQNEVFMDCGAYTGDSVLSFVDALRERDINSYRKVIAFEPDANRWADFKENTKALTNVELVPKGVWSVSTTLNFRVNEELSSELDPAGTDTVEVAAIDDVLGNDPVTFIKMDVQGAELEALKGAQVAIARHRPTLAICAYHEHRDLIDLPAFIKNIEPGYELFLRAHRSKSNELVLYAIPPSR